MSADFELFAAFLINVWRAVHGELLDTCRQRNRSADRSASALRRVHDLLGGVIENAVVEGLQADANVLTLHFDLKLLVDFRNHASTNGAATFTDGKAQLFFHGDWRD